MNKDPHILLISQPPIAFHAQNSTLASIALLYFFSYIPVDETYTYTCTSLYTSKESY